MSQCTLSSANPTSLFSVILLLRSIEKLRSTLGYLTGHVLLYIAYGHKSKTTERSVGRDLIPSFILIHLLFNFRCKFRCRCETRVPNQPAKRGAVKYIGSTHFKSGLWVGVQYDEPSGKNNGTVDDKFYFECPDKYGAFIKPQYVAVGDYPELGLDDLDEI